MSCAAHCKSLVGIDVPIGGETDWDDGGLMLVCKCMYYYYDSY